MSTAPHGNGSKERVHRCVAAVAIVLALVAGACGGGGGGGEGSSGSSSGGTASSDQVLHTAFFQDLNPPDPDLYYDTEGLQLINAVYDGLVQYKNDNSTKIVPSLAESWKTSDAGKTYTFKLRSAKFHDGTAFDSAAAKFSFERRTKVNGPPGYTVASVKSIETPDPRTLVVHLKTVVAPFLDYLASPYGVRMMSPTLIKAHETKADGGQKYLLTHDAGTGPYTITKYKLGQVYELSRFGSYWGTKPNFASVQVEILPEAATQQLKLEGGDLDIVHLQPSTTVEAFRNKEGFQVTGFPVMQRTFLQINVRKAPWDDVGLRSALRQAVDKESIVRTALKGVGTVATGFYPKGMVEGVPDNDPYKPGPLQEAMKKLPSGQQQIVVGHVVGKPDDQRIAETLQARFTQLGVKSKVQALTYAQLSDLGRSDSTAGQPDIFVNTANPDAVHPDTWIRIFFNTRGPANVMRYSNSKADALMDKGLAEPDADASSEDYKKAGQLIQQDAAVVSLADITDTFIAGEGLTGLTHQVLPPYAIGFGAPLAKSG